MLYSCKYRTNLFWVEVKNIKADWVMPENKDRRVLLTADGRWIELPPRTEIIFSPEREIARIENAKKEGANL
jgi:hypothetical protein